MLKKGIEWTLRKKLVQAVMSMYKGAKARVQVGGGHSEDFDVSVGVHQGSALSPFLFSIVLDVM